MPRTTRLSAVLVFASLLGGCAAQSRFMRPGAEFPPVPSDAARVVFIRPSSFAFGVVVTIVDSEGRFIGDSSAKSRFAASLPAGEYTFVAWGEGTHSLKANIVAGRTYYVEVAPVLGVWSARFHLKAIKATTRNWPNLQVWLRDTSPRDVLQEEGQAYVAGRREAADDAIRKGVARFAEYNAEETDDRTLEPDDGT